MSIESELKRLGEKQETMDKSELLILTKNIYSNLTKKSYGEVFGEDYSEYNIIIERYNGVTLFNREASESLERAVKLIQNDPIYAKNISAGKISEEYKSFVVDSLPEDSISDAEIQSNIDRLLKKLRNSIGKYKVIMPIERLELLDLSEVRLGNVRLTPFSTLEAEFGPILDLVQKEDMTKIWAEVSIEEEWGKAIQRGEYEIEKIINLLRIYIPKLFNETYNKKIGLYEYHMKTRNIYTIDTNGKGGKSGRNLGPFGMYKLSRERFECLTTNYCLSDISEILSKDNPSRSELERSIIMAVRWLGLGIDEEIISEKFLKYAIALECLLIKKDENDKTDPLAKRTAFILGKTIDECTEIEKKIKALYGIRSIIVHQGIEEEKEDLIKKSARDLYEYTLEILLELTRKTTGEDKLENVGQIISEMDVRTYSR